MKIAIIDDDTEFLALVRATLENMGDYEILCFSLPTEALGWCMHNDPDLVIVDYLMPKLDGMAFIRQFRALEGKTDTPILMLSSRQENFIRYQALAFGAMHFLTKPFDTTKFHAFIKSMIAARQRHKLPEIHTNGKKNNQRIDNQ